MYFFSPSALDPGFAPLITHTFIDSLPFPLFSISIAFILSFVLQINQIRPCPLRSALEKKTSFTFLILCLSNFALAFNLMAHNVFSVVDSRTEQ